jgi:hypothetical protein
MNSKERELDQLKSFKDQINSSKANFDSAQKIEFSRRLDSYYAALNQREALSRDLVDSENSLLKLRKVLNIFYGFLLIFAVATTFLKLPLLVFIATSLVIIFVHLTSNVNKYNLVHQLCTNQILLCDAEIIKAVRGYLRHKDAADAVRTNDSFRKSLESEEILMIQDLYEAEVQVSIINEMSK